MAGKQSFIAGVLKGVFAFALCLFLLVTGSGNLAFGVNDSQLTVSSPRVLSSQTGFSLKSSLQTTFSSFAPASNSNRNQTKKNLDLQIEKLELADDQYFSLGLKLYNHTEKDFPSHRVNLYLSRLPFTSPQDYQNWLAHDYISTEKANSENQPLKDFVPTVSLGNIMLPATPAASGNSLNLRYSTLSLSTPGVYGIEISDPHGELSSVRGVLLWQLDQAKEKNSHKYVNISTFVHLGLSREELGNFLHSDLDIDTAFQKIPMGKFDLSFQDSAPVKNIPVTWIIDPLLLNSFKEDLKNNRASVNRLRTYFKQHDEVFFGSWGSIDTGILADNEANYTKAIRSHILKKFFPEQSNISAIAPDSNLLASQWLENSTSDPQALNKLRGLLAITAGICNFENENEDQENSAASTPLPGNLILSLPVNDFSKVSTVLESLGQDSWVKFTRLKRSAVDSSEKNNSSDKKLIPPGNPPIAHPDSLASKSAAFDSSTTEVNSSHLASFQSDLERISADAAHVIFPLRERLILSYSPSLSPQQQQQSLESFNSLLNRSIEALSAQASSQINLISDQGELPVKVANQLPIPVSVVVNLAPPEKSFRALKQIPITLGPHEGTTVKIPVKAEQDLKSQASVWLDFPGSPAPRALGELELEKSPLTQIKPDKSTHYGTTQTISIKVKSGLETRLFFGLSSVFLGSCLAVGTYMWWLGRKKYYSAKNN